MRWLADENIPGAAVAFLRRHGEDVLAIAEIAPGVPDEEVLERARVDRRILLSFDRDHRDLIFHHGIAAPPAVVYFRLTPPDPNTVARILAGLMLLGEDALPGKFTVITADGMRQRALLAKT
jgi:predicted nuclease of predicted toxin-antitoxin system